MNIKLRLKLTNWARNANKSLIISMVNNSMFVVEVFGMVEEPMVLNPHTQTHRHTHTHTHTHTNQRAEDPTQLNEEQTVQV
jgi:hypothetical protein